VSNDSDTAVSEPSVIEELPPQSGGGEKAHYLGHRARLRQRVLGKGADSLADYEIVEFLLFGAQPRGDMKPLAKRLIERFGSLAAVLSAEPGDLAQVSGMGPSSIAALKIVPEAARRMALADIRERPVISSWDKLLDYCRVVMGRDKIERFRLLFLDKKNRLILDEEQQRGTVDHTPVYTREVMKRALEVGATALILVHNHPSGDTTPSKADIEITLELKSAAEKLGIVIHDHVIISRSNHASFKALGLI